MAWTAIRNGPLIIASEVVLNDNDKTFSISDLPDRLTTARALELLAIRIEYNADASPAAVRNPIVQIRGRDEVITTGDCTVGGDVDTLIDTAASFISDGIIHPGDIATNVTDGSVAQVVSVDSESTITTTALTGGGSNDWLSVVPDVYSISTFDVFATFEFGASVAAGAQQVFTLAQNALSNTGNSQRTDRLPDGMLIGQALDLRILEVLNQSAADDMIVHLHLKAA